MSFRAGSMAIGASAVLASLSLTSSDARACGGCLPVERQLSSTVVTGHRMAVSLSTDRTVLWDQISYAGEPEEFAWVLPVKPGATLELANDAFFEALEAGTTTVVASPNIQCQPSNGTFDGDYGSPGCSMGCGQMASAEAISDRGGGGFGTGGGEPTPPVTVVHQDTVGPYETVTIHSNVPGALFTWLESHGYGIDESVKPVVDDYEIEGFDFIALRLIPGANVRQMQPVRVVSPGASPVLPLRMVAAGTGAEVAITLFVIGEGRWEAQSFANTTITRDGLSWDFAAQSSNYATLRDEALKQNEGAVWLTTYARAGALLSPVEDALASFDFGNGTTYLTSGGDPRNTIATLYVAQGLENGVEGVTQLCFSAFEQAVESGAKVVACAPADEGEGGGGNGASGGAGGAGGSGGSGGTGGSGGAPPECVLAEGEIDAATLACGTLDDVAAALVGLHPKDTWITRLEANLPRAALADDLSLQAETSQTEHHSRKRATEVLNPPCDEWIALDEGGLGGSGGEGGDGGSAAIAPAPHGPSKKGPPPRRTDRDLLLLATCLAIAGSTALRRAFKPRLRIARTSR